MFLIFFVISPTGLWLRVQNHAMLQKTLCSIRCYSMSSIVVPFCGLHLGSHKVIPKSNYYGAYGIAKRGTVEEVSHEVRTSPKFNTPTWELSGTLQWAPLHYYTPNPIRTSSQKPQHPCIAITYAIATLIYLSPSLCRSPKPQALNPQENSKDNSLCP